VARRGLTYDDTLPGDMAGVSVITPDSVRQLKERHIRGVRIEQSVSHRVALGARLTDVGVARLRDYPALRTPGADDSFVAISSSTALTDRSLVAVGDLAGVVSLDVHYSVFGSRKYTEAGVAHLQRMTSLEELNFLGDLATDGVLRKIAAIPRLRRLSCQDMIAADDGFRALARCATVESIWGRHCHWRSADAK
jgi:hypothetical protein